MAAISPLLISISSHLSSCSRTLKLAASNRFSLKNPSSTAVASLSNPPRCCISLSNPTSAALCTHTNRSRPSPHLIQWRHLHRGWSILSYPDIRLAGVRNSAHSYDVITRK